MGIIRENINFERGMDPKTSMGIGYLSELQNRFNGDFDFAKLSPNQLLIIGVNYSVKDDLAHYDLIKYSLDKGANQLWQNSRMSEIVQIDKVNKISGKVEPKITYKTIWHSRGLDVGRTFTSVKFRIDYTPITEKTIEELNDRIIEIENFKEAIENLKIPLEKSPY